MGNTTNAQCTEHSLPESQLVAAGSLAFYSTLGVLGVFGNVNVILVFASSREKSLRFLVTVLSVLDLLISGLVLPTDCYRVYTDYLARSQGREPTNHWFSTLIMSSRYAAFEMEAWILVFIAVDRYLCIVKARQNGLSYRKTIGALIGAGVSLLLLELCNVISHYLVEDRCALKLKLESYLMYFYGALGTLSVLVVMVLYVRIFTFVASMERRRSSRHQVTERTLAMLSRVDVPTDTNGGGEGDREGGGEGIDTCTAVETTKQMPSDGRSRADGNGGCGGDSSSKPTATSATLKLPVERGRRLASSSGEGNGCTDGPTVSQLCRPGGSSDLQSSCSFLGGNRPVTQAGRPKRSKHPGQRDGNSESWFPKKLAWMLFGATVLFYGSMLPMILINFKLLPDSPLHRIFYLNTSLNFFVYAMMNSKFRTELGRIYARRCRRCCCREPGNQ